MNNLPIDLLLQLPVSRPESPSSATRPRNDSPEFGNHFSQASDAGGIQATPPAPAPRRTDSASSDAEKNHAERRPSTHADRANQPADQNNLQRPSNSKPLATSATASEDEPAQKELENDSETEDVEVQAANEVASLLAAAEQLANAAPVETDVTGVIPPVDELEVDATTEPVASTADGKQDAPQAEGPKRPAKPSAVENQTGGEQLPANSTSDSHDRADKSESPVAELSAELDGAIQPSEEAIDSSDAGKNSKITPSNDGTANGIDPNQDSGETSPAADKAAPTAQKLAQAASLASKNSQSATDNTSKNNASKYSDKKSTTRVSATSGDTTQPPTERQPTAAAATSVATTNLPPIAAATASVSGAAAAEKVGSAKEVTTSKPGPLSPFARLERGSQASREGHRAGQSEAARHIDPARFVSRVARAIHTAQERGGPLQLRLSPAELGAMRLEIAVNQGALTATIETDNQSARQLLLDNLPALRERLAEQNIKIERFDVDVRRDSTGSEQQRASQDRGNTNEHTSHRGGHNPSGRNSGAPSVDEATPTRRTITTTSINVVA